MDNCEKITVTLIIIYEKGKTKNLKTSREHKRKSL